MVVTPSPFRSSSALKACLSMTFLALHRLNGCLPPAFPSPHGRRLASPQPSRRPFPGSRHRWLFCDDRFDFSAVVFTEFFSTEQVFAGQRAAEQKDRGDSVAITTPTKQSLPTW